MTLKRGQNIKYLPLAFTEHGQGVFAPLRDPAYFARVRVNPDLGTICWPNDADWDPLVLYSLVTGRPIESLLTRPGSVGG